MTTDALQLSASRLKNWCSEHALPVWVERAHLQDGSWVEHLHLDGQPDLTAERRWRVLARQVYVYAKATSLGWFEGQYIAKATYRKMKTVGYVHRVSMDDTVINDMRDLYDHAFYVLAASSLFALTGQSKYLEDADALLDWVDSALSHPQGGWRESDRATPTDARRQNPHMHLFEASLFLYGASKQERHLSFAKRVYTLFETHFFDHGTVSEFFDSHWTLSGGETGQTNEPGHAMEWIWLLGEFSKATGENTRHYQDALLSRALAGRGYFLNDEEAKDGEIRRETKRLWVQTEVIKAYLAMTENGVPGAADMAAATIDALFPTYLTPEGLWNDQINACGANIAKTIPVSTFYHILCMASEANRVAEKRLLKAHIERLGNQA